MPVTTVNNSKRPGTSGVFNLLSQAHHVEGQLVDSLKVGRVERIR